MKNNKILFLVIVLFLIGCSPISTPATMPIQPQNIPTLTNTSQPTQTPDTLSTLISLDLATPLALFAGIQNPCAKPVTQLELNMCASQKNQETYSLLDTLIDELQNHLDIPQYENLLKIELDWERTALEHCKWQANFFGDGSVQQMWFQECINQQYLDRIDSLRLNLCEGNGMTGECEESLKYKISH